MTNCCFLSDVFWEYVHEDTGLQKLGDKYEHVLMDLVSCGLWCGRVTIAIFRLFRM
jgi:hypothetical protein